MSSLRACSRCCMAPFHPHPPVAAEHAPLPPMTLLRRGPWTDEPVGQPELQATIAAAVEAPA
eukprot:5411610-Lingulodinium_polyedra.AAC.1